MGEALKRHTSYLARIVDKPADDTLWAKESGVRPPLFSYSEVLYCRDCGVPWPCEVEQRDMLIDLLEGRVIID